MLDTPAEVSIPDRSQLWQGICTTRATLAEQSATSKQEGINY